jgi:hypothetical protein
MSSNDAIRYAAVWLFIGFPGTGKTTGLLRSLGWNEKKNKCTGDKRALMLTYAEDDDAIQHIPAVDPRMLGYLKPGPGVYRLKVDRLEFIEILRCIKKSFKNGFIILDDCTDEIGYNPSAEMKAAIRGVRHNGNDLFFLHQHLNDVSPFVYKLAWYLNMFRQGDVKFAPVLDKVARYDEVVRAFKWVQDRNTSIYDSAFIVLDPKDTRFYDPFEKINNTRT